MHRKRPAVEAPYLDMVREFRRGEKRRELESRSRLSPKPEPELTPEPESTPEPTGIHPALNLESGSESDEDVDFEDVNLDDSDEEAGPDLAAEPQDISISLDAGRARHLTKTRKKTLRKPQRLLQHKLALCAWMLHAQLRNKWLAAPGLLASDVFTNILPESVRLEIFPPQHLTPFLKSKKLIDGLEHALEVWRARFAVVRPGLASASPGGDLGTFDEFCAQLLSLQGSPDLLGQGYVALMRALGLEARLVCSLQPPDNLQTEPAGPSSGTSACPLYWAEVWDPHTSKWIVVDPLTGTIRLPTRSKVRLKIEPPQNDKHNVLRYCMAFDGRGYARDVTRRYAFAYNSRTRKKRLPYVESEAWLDRLTAVFCVPYFSTSDTAELLELARYPCLEGIPSRVQDFVGHPDYALADQLHRNEVLRPHAKPIGVLAQKPTRGRANKDPNAQPAYIYRRSDVQVARSSQSWYKQGREIKVGAQPRAHRPLKNRLTGEEEQTALYTWDQTEEYQAPTVGPDGVVPKSVYRTVDLFTPHMCPIGATHIPEKLAVTAAKILRIDYANAVVAVEYGKRGAQSTTLGIVVADAYVPAVLAVMNGLRELEQAKREQENTVRILKLWRQFIMGVQIRERVDSMNPEHANAGVKEELEDEAEEMQEMRSEVEEETEHEPVYRNFHALIRRCVPIPRTAAPTVDARAVERLRAQIHASPEPGPVPEIVKPVIPEGPYSSDSFDDIDNEEISESDL